MFSLYWGWGLESEIWKKRRLPSLALGVRLTWLSPLKVALFGWVILWEGNEWSFIAKMEPGTLSHYALPWQLIWLSFIKQIGPLSLMESCLVFSFSVLLLRFLLVFPINLWRGNSHVCLATLGTVLCWTSQAFSSPPSGSRSLSNPLIPSATQMFGFSLARKLVRYK